MSGTQIFWPNQLKLQGPVNPGGSQHWQQWSAFQLAKCICYFLLSQPRFLQWWTFQATWRSLPAVWFKDNSSYVAAVICNGDGRFSLNDDIGSWRKGKACVIYQISVEMDKLSLKQQNRTEFKTIKIRVTLSSWSVLFMKLLQKPLASLTTWGKHLVQPAEMRFDLYWYLSLVLAWRNKTKPPSLRYWKFTFCRKSGK